MSFDILLISNIYHFRVYIKAIINGGMRPIQNWMYLLNIKLIQNIHIIIFYLSIYQAIWTQTLIDR